MQTDDRQTMVKIEAFQSGALPQAAVVCPEKDALLHLALEARVQERTAELVRSVEALQTEICERTLAERTARDQLAHLAEQSRQAAVLEERNRIAREIHDTLAQAFTGILIQLGVARRIVSQQPEEAWELVGRVEQLARQGLAEARRSVWALQPQATEYRDLATALPHAVEQLISSTPVRAHVSVHGTPRPLPADVGMNLLRIGQEAVNNTLRHAHAHELFIALTFDDDQVRLCIRDDGQGFDLRQQEEGGGFGLIGMRQRAERIGGQLTLSSEPGQGTEVAVTAPAVVEPNGQGSL
jgi:signal transduction histidine kinase